MKTLISLIMVLEMGFLPQEGFDLTYALLLLEPGSFVRIGGGAPADTDTYPDELDPVTVLSPEPPPSPTAAPPPATDTSLPPPPRETGGTATAAPSGAEPDNPPPINIPGGITMNNETKYSVDLAALAKEKLTQKLGPPEKGAQILIMHTHAQEHYWDYGKAGIGVIEVGERLAELWREKGFVVIHDTTMYSSPDFNRSYASALKGITKILEKNPNIGMVIDLHRDAVYGADGKPRKILTNIGGEDTAQLMFVMGTDANGLTHPDWKNNLRFAVKLQQRLNAGDSKLCRPINLRKERFNEHLTPGSMLLEVGSHANTGAEVIRAIEIFAEQTSDILLDLVQKN